MKSSVNYWYYCLLFTLEFYRNRSNQIRSLAYSTIALAKCVLSIKPPLRHYVIDNITMPSVHMNKRSVSTFNFETVKRPQTKRTVFDRNSSPSTPQETPKSTPPLPLHNPAQLLLKSSQEEKSFVFVIRGAIKGRWVSWGRRAAYLKQ